MNLIIQKHLITSTPNEITNFKHEKLSTSYTCCVPHVSVIAP